jgi:hypothetical protein
LFSVIDQEDTLAHLFHLVHLMCAHNDSCPPIAHSVDLALNHACIDRIQAAEGLIDNDQLRFVQCGCDKLSFLVHTPTQPGYLAIASFPQIHLLEGTFGAFMSVLVFV